MMCAIAHAFGFIGALQLCSWKERKSCFFTPTLTEVDALVAADLVFKIELAVASNHNCT
jgi:hypothetical protein